MSWALPEELRQLAECGDPGLVDEILSVFRTDTARRLGVMRAALDGGQRMSLRSEAHAIKGSAGQVGASSLASMCQRLEATALTAPVGDLANLLGEIETAFTQICQQMPQ